MLKRILYIIIAVCFLATITFGGIQSYRLVKTRQQLESVRMELSAATNRQSELAEILRRDSKILCESSNTISGIRSQIAVIRESYEEMQNLIDSDHFSYDR